MMQDLSLLASRSTLLQQVSEPLLLEPSHVPFVYILHSLFIHYLYLLLEETEYLIFIPESPEFYWPIGFPFGASQVHLRQEGRVT